MTKKTTKTKKSIKYVIGIDLGGTNVVAVLVNTSGKVKSYVDFPTQATKGSEFIINNMAENVKALVKKSGLTL